MSNSFLKFDGGKLQPSLFPPEAIASVTHVLMYGAAKYAPNNWRKCEDLSRYKDALLRHWLEYQKDPASIDEESGLPHLWHAACNMMFLVTLEAQAIS